MSRLCCTLDQPTTGTPATIPAPPWRWIRPRWPPAMESSSRRPNPGTLLTLTSLTPLVAPVPPPPSSFPAPDLPKSRGPADLELPCSPATAVAQSTKPRPCSPATASRGLPLLPWPYPTTSHRRYLSQASDHQPSTTALGARKKSLLLPTRKQQEAAGIQRDLKLRRSSAPSAVA